MKLTLTNEAKTGAFVVLCLVALGLLLLKVGNFNFFKSGYTVRSKFNYTAGVKKHAPVRLSGVDVGEVRDIALYYGDETKIELVLWLREGVKIRLDSKAYVTTLGLMGEKYVEIKAGTAAAEYAKDGEYIPGEDPMRLEDLIEVGMKVAENVSEMTDEIEKLARNVNSVVDDGKPKLSRIFNNLEETSENFRDFSQDIRFHPWKILAKGKEKTPEEMERERRARLAKAGKLPPGELAPAEEAAPVSNFARRR